MLKKITGREKTILFLILLIGIGAVGYFGYENLTSKPVTVVSQQQAETPSGISLAAHNSHVKLLQDQLEAASQQIARLKNKPPDTIIKTVPYEVERVVNAEVGKRGADFAIVTDPKHPEEQVAIKDLGKLPGSTEVTLNQYNVFAYKKVVKGITIYPKFTGLTPRGVSEITGDISRKISNDGKYIGIVGGYDFDNKKAKVGLRITF